MTKPHYDEPTAVRTDPLKLLLDRVGKTFAGNNGEVVALDNINLAVGDGEFVVLVGPVSKLHGKSTILNLVAGLDFPTAGKVTLNGRTVSEPGRDRMVMFQEAALFPWLDVLGNVMFGLRLNKDLNDAERRETAAHYLDLVGLTKFKRAHIHELSGGMRQRVAPSPAASRRISRTSSSWTSRSPRSTP